MNSQIDLSKTIAELFPTRSSYYWKYYVYANQGSFYFEIKL